MGNESSTPVDESTPPTTLYARNIDAVAKYVQDRQVRRVVVMVSIGTHNLGRNADILTDRRWYQYICWDT
jgi:hypothetical protein